MTMLIVTGTGTDVGKTMTVAAIAACRLATGATVAVLKPAQTGVQLNEQGDTGEVARLAESVTTHELARFPDPLAPNTAARRAGVEAVSIDAIVEAADRLNATHDLVLVEGAGGLLVRFDDNGNTLADVAKALNAATVVVVSAGLGTLNTTALTTEALQHRNIECLGLVIGRWPANPDLASRTNINDLCAVSDVPLLGALPEGLGRRDPATFRSLAPSYLAPALGGQFDVNAFAELHSA